MTSAELTFKTGFGPHLSTTALKALLAACEEDDPRLLQGSTTTPPPLMCVQDWPVEAGCAFGFCGAVENGGFCPPELRKNKTAAAAFATVGECEEYFARLCFAADETLGEPAACRWFLNWFDDTPRDKMPPTLAGWCRDLLAGRETAVTRN